VFQENSTSFSTHNLIHFHYDKAMIGHEVLHNLGYNHPSPSHGSFIKEFGRCTQYVGNVPADFNLTGSGQEKEE
jgi:hypothetical protein